MKNVQIPVVNLAKKCKFGEKSHRSDPFLSFLQNGGLSNRTPTAHLPHTYRVETRRHCSRQRRYSSGRTAPFTYHSPTIHLPFTYHLLTVHLLFTKRPFCTFCKRPQMATTVLDRYMHAVVCRSFSDTRKLNTVKYRSINVHAVQKTSNNRPITVQ